MNRALFRNATALGLGLVVLAPAAAAAQEDCLQRVEQLQREAEALDNGPPPQISHLVEAAQRFAEQGEQQACLDVAQDIEEFLTGVARTPDVAETGPAVQRPVPPPLAAHPEEVIDEGEARAEPEAERQTVSPVSPPPPTADREHPQPPDTLAGVPPDELPVEELVGRPLINNWGAEIGYVEGFVVPADDPEDVYAVVSETGEPGYQGDEVLVAVDRLRVPHPRAVQWAVGEGETQELEDQPRFDPAQFEPLPLNQQLGAATGG